MSKANRQRKPARPEPFRQPRKRILVVAEGLTEKEYVEGYLNHRRADLVSVINVEVRGRIGVPMTVVQTAKKLKADAADDAARQRDQNLNYDSVWAVFDVDDHPKLKNAIEMARDNEIRCAVSNASFELWLYLHFKPSPGMQDRTKLLRLLKEHVPAYGKRVAFKDYVAGVTDAVEKAKRLDQAAEADNDHHRNPTTGMWGLIEEIESGDRASS
jgi:hypothetical protein